jgi:hypothetical protein
MLGEINELDGRVEGIEFLGRKDIQAEYELTPNPL